MGKIIYQCLCGKHDVMFHVQDTPPFSTIKANFVVKECCIKKFKEMTKFEDDLIRENEVKYE